MSRTRRRRLAALAALAALGLGLLAAGAQAQDRLRGDVLGDDLPIAFSDAEDTVIEAQLSRDARTRADLDTAELRGPNTLAGPDDPGGERDYLLGLSASGAIGIGAEVTDRYEHGRVEDARLHLAYQGGCNSPNGELTIRSIENRSWSPFEVAWEDTTRADGSLAVNGTLLARVPLSPGAVQENPDVDCNEATVALRMDPLRDVLAGHTGGISMFWSGERPLSVSTLDGFSPPRIEVNFTTNGPSIHNVSLRDEAPAIVPTGERFRVRVNATDPQPLPEGAVTVNLTRSDGEFTVLDAPRSGRHFVASHTFAAEDEGRYSVEASVEDGDGWTDRATPNGSAPHLVADGTEPGISVPRLGGQPDNRSVRADQGDAIPLSFNVSELGCEVGASPCGSWRLDWNGTRLAGGNLTPAQRVEANVSLPAPGNTTARLAVRDPVGHRNASTTWNLSVRDTHPPEARPLEGSRLTPGQATTVENGTPVEVRFRIEDDLPVQARLLLEGEAALERPLPDHDDEGVVEATLTSVPEGSYQASIVLDDGRHVQRLDFGRLRVAPEGAPDVAIDLSSPRLAPDGVVPARIRDRNLDPERTRVAAEVNGLEVRPDVETEPVPDGQDLRILLGGLSHGDEVNVVVQARDEQGLEARGAAVLTVDAQAPRLESPGNRSWVRPGDQVRFEAPDPGGGPARLRVEAPGATLEGPAPRSVSVDRLVPTPGRLTPLTVRLTDDLGNERVRRVAVGVDDEPPSLSARFTDEGLVALASDEASGIRNVQARVAVGGGPLNATGVFREGPDRYAVDTPPLTRGDEVRVALLARDRVGETTRLGTADEPETLVVPDRPPTLELERASPAIGETGRVSWNASDPDRDPLDVQLSIAGPSGDTRRPVDASGSHEIEPDERGRYEVSLEATSGPNATAETTFFYLAPGGRVTEVSGAPARVEPGQPYAFTLSFPGEPDQVFVTALDEENASRSATVELDGSTARAHFDGLPEGQHRIEATVVHETGAVERVQVASVNADEPLSSQLGDLAIPLLIALAVALVVAIAVLVYRERRDGEDEATEPAP